MLLSESGDCQVAVLQSRASWKLPLPFKVARFNRFLNLTQLRIAGGARSDLFANVFGIPPKNIVRKPSHTSGRDQKLRVQHFLKIFAPLET